MTPRGSISGPIVFASVGVALSLAMLVGWIFVVATSPTVIAGRVWLIVLGVVSLVTIITVLVLFAVFLVLRILEARRQSRFIDSVTHELKSPLASLKLCLETLGRPELNDAQRDELRRMMAADVGRLSTFIEDVLAASRLVGTLARDPVPHADVGLRDLALACAETVEARHDLPPGTLAVDVPADLALRSDETALRTVVVNLVDNAVKYSDPDRVVVALRGHLEDGRVVLEVSDEGVGIPRDALDRVFERFYRVDSEAVRSRRGTGLGLYVASALARTLGGRLTAHSDGPGTGTIMRVRFDRRRRAPAPTTAALVEGAP